MARAWKIVLTLLLTLIVIGAVLIAIGLFTGGSVTRMVEVVFGGQESLELLLDVLKQELGAIFVSIG